MVLCIQILACHATFTNQLSLGFEYKLCIKWYLNFDHIGSLTFMCLPPIIRGFIKGGKHNFKDFKADRLICSYTKAKENNCKCMSSMESIR